MHLRCELRGHGEDVRGLCVCPLGLVSCSRDKTIRIWKEVSSTEFETDTTLIGHDDFVTALAWMGAGLSAQFPNGALVSGSRDMSVRVWDHDNGIPAQTMKGHEYQVTDLSIMEDGAIVSSSIDKTMRVWKDGKEVSTLTGHEGPILCLLVLPNEFILSGSGDKSMRLWKNGQCVSNFSGHADTVRGLAILPDMGVVSASHDHTLRVWTFDCTCIGQLVGHNAIVYSCATSEQGLIASGSEDNTARVWKADGTCISVLKHPGCVWVVAFLPNEDLVTGCSDGIIRIWSISEDRKAPAEVIQTLEASVEAKQEELLSSQKGALPPGLNLEDPAVLLSPGTKDGEHKVVREGNSAVVYGWSAEKGEWEKIGDVMGDNGGDVAMGSKTFCKGREWDYVFDVDVEDGAPVKKLCMNRGDNPHLVAERFLIENNLPGTYVDQVIQFIMAKTEHMPVVNADPLTGGGAYVPGVGGAGSSVPSGMLPVTGGGFDPLTGGTPKRLKYSPKRSHVFFDTVRPIASMASKIQSFNSELASQPDVALNQQQSGGDLQHLLEESVKSAQGQAPTSFSESDFSLLQKLMGFPAHQIFPVLDICRMMALDSKGQDVLSSLVVEPHSQQPGILGNWIFSSDAANGLPANQQMGLQFLCNCFKQPTLRKWVLNNRGKLVEGFRNCCQSTGKNVRLGLSTLLLNFAVEAQMEGASIDEQGKQELLEVAIQILTTIPADDFESGFRAMVAGATLMYDSPKLKKFGSFQGIQDWAEKRTQVPGVPQKLKEAVDDIEIVLK